MINFSTLQIGESVFQVVPTSNVFARKKILMVDDNGIEWYRYDKHRYTYSIKTHTYVGRADTIVQGRVIAEDVDDTKYFFEHEVDGMSYMFANDFNDPNIQWFLSREDAEAQLELNQEEQAKIDRS